MTPPSDPLAPLLAPLLAALAALLLVLAALPGLIDGWRRDSARLAHRSSLMGGPMGPGIALMTRLIGPRGTGPGRHYDDLLRDAGRPFGGLSGQEYLAFVVLLAVTVGAAMAAFLMGVAGLGPLAGLAGAVLVAGLTGFASVTLLHGTADRRRLELNREFPFFMDMATMALEAGATQLESIQVYVRTRPTGALTGELRLMLGELALGTRFDDALETLGERIGSPQIRAVLRAIRQGVDMGSPLQQVLRDQAADLRFLRSQQAERAAERMKVRIQGPIVLMIVGLLLLIVGPAVVETAALQL